MLLSGFELHLVLLQILAQARALLHPRAFDSSHFQYLQTSGSESRAVRSSGSISQGMGLGEAVPQAKEGAAFLLPAFLAQGSQEL